MGANKPVLLYLPDPTHRPGACTCYYSLSRSLARSLSLSRSVSLARALSLPISPLYTRPPLSATAALLTDVNSGRVG